MALTDEPSYRLFRESESLVCPRYACVTRGAANSPLCSAREGDTPAPSGRGGGRPPSGRETHTRSGGRRRPTARAAGWPSRRASRGRSRRGWYLSQARGRDFLRANANGHAAPEKCLAAHLLGDDDEPIHLEVCNASFEDNVTQRLRGAKLREDYTQLLDPRGVCLWADGVRSDEAFRKLRESELALPTLSSALEMLGMDDGDATEAAQELHAWREQQEGVTVRGDVV